MRNGSMVIEHFGPNQGYDSRSKTYDPGCSITYPCKLAPDRTLISTLSRDYPIGESCGRQIMWDSEKKQRTLLRTAAVLTCLASEPPADAFRPPYAGTEKPIYRAGDLKWDLLLNLKLDNMEGYFQRPWPGGEASWENFEGYFQRPWLSHSMTRDFDQVLSFMQPNENQPGTRLGLLRAGRQPGGFHRQPDAAPGRAAAAKGETAHRHWCSADSTSPGCSKPPRTFRRIDAAGFNPGASGRSSSPA